MKKISIAILLLIISGFAFSIEKLDSTFNEEDYYLGDRIQQTIVYNKYITKNTARINPKYQDNSLKIISKNIVYEKNKTIISIEYTSFELGAKSIPRINISYPGGKLYTPANKIKIISAFEKTSSRNYISTLRPQKSIKLHILSYFLLLTGCLVTSIVLLYAWSLLASNKKQQDNVEEYIDPYTRAMEKLNKVTEPTKKNYYTISEIIKEYLSNSLGIQLKEKTTNEINKNLKQVYILSKEYKAKIMIILEKIDPYKYTQASSTVNEFNGVISNSKELLSIINIAITKDKDNDN